MWSEILTVLWAGTLVGIVTYGLGWRAGHVDAVREIANAAKEHDRERRLSAVGGLVDQHGESVPCVGWVAVVATMAPTTSESPASGADAAPSGESDVSAYGRMRAAVERWQLERWWNGPTKEEHREGP